MVKEPWMSGNVSKNTLGERYEHMSSPTASKTYIANSPYYLKK